MASPITPTPTLDEGEWEIFQEKIKEGLKNPIELTPTPKLKTAIEKIMEVHRKTMRESSGKIDSSDKIVAFLYTLMRDHLPTGTVERIVIDITMNNYTECQFTNGWLAEYANDIKERLTKQ
jgi:hypothetical protein